MSASEQSRAVSPKPTAKIPGASGLQGLFELAILWAIVWAFPIGLSFAVAGLLDAAFPTGRASVHAVLGLLIGLATGVALIWVGNKRGMTFGSVAAAYVHEYAVVLALAVGFVAGWLFRP